MSKRNPISDKEREILEDLYRNSMVGTGLKEKTFLKKWYSNRRRHWIDEDSSYPFMYL